MKKEPRVRGKSPGRNRVTPARHTAPVLPLVLLLAFVAAHPPAAGMADAAECATEWADVDGLEALGPDGADDALGAAVPTEPGVSRPALAPDVSRPVPETQPPEA